MRRFLLALIVPLIAAPAFAAPAFTDGGAVDVARVVDGETLVLADERVMRLVAIDVPQRGALAAQAKAALAALIDGQALSVKFSGSASDRQGRVLAELYAGGKWVQGELLRRGLARVAGTADHRVGLPEMLKLERQARRYRRGLWAEPAYAIVPAAEAGRHAGSFALVTGTVAQLVNNSSGTLLVFGADQHNGFVLSVAPDVVKLCREAGLDPAALVGKAVLTRGYVDGTRRPTIAVMFPEQIEVIRQKKAAPKSLPGPR
ncbi:MAG TPA: thermonuclease family protein [Stellaceae bacterium]|jgi:endonuclease YncB( thermonuclease family)|nr:thermonuclease family protein [Stellaceae bacterium]